jgi:hypothetical protein
MGELIQLSDWRLARRRVVTTWELRLVWPVGYIWPVLALVPVTHQEILR